MASDPVIEYKQRIISEIISTPSIVELIDPEKVDAGETLIYENVFPFNRVPMTEEETKTYITVKVEVTSNYMTNALFKDINIIVFIITHQDLMRIGKGRGATRIDLLGREIKELFDHKSFGLAKVELLSSLETAVDFKHPCRILTFQTQDLRSKDCDS